MCVMCALVDLPFAVAVRVRASTLGRFGLNVDVAGVRSGAPAATVITGSWPAADAAAFAAAAAGAARVRAAEAPSGAAAAPGRTALGGTLASGVGDGV